MLDASVLFFEIAEMIHLNLNWSSISKTTRYFFPMLALIEK